MFEFQKKTVVLRRNKKMENQIKLLRFQIEKQQFAIPVEYVERIIQIVELIEIPDAPSFFPGLLNLYGELIPVVNLRVLFRFKERETELSDQLIVLNAKTVKIALHIDATLEVMNVGQNQIVGNSEITFNNTYIRGIAKTENDILVIHHPEEFLQKEHLLKMMEIIRKMEPKTST